MLMPQIKIAYILKIFFCPVYCRAISKYRLKQFERKFVSKCSGRSPFGKIPDRAHDKKELAISVFRV
jgi:hypothetical protein